MFHETKLRIHKLCKQRLVIQGYCWGGFWLRIIHFPVESVLKCFEIIIEACAMDKLVLENLHLSHFSSNWSHLKQFNQAAWNHRVTGALFSNFWHRNDMWVGWKSWSDLFCEGCWLATLHLAHISPAQILDTDCVPKCHMSSHKLLILTGISSVLYNLKKSSFYFGHLELWQLLGKTTHTSNTTVFSR